MPVLSQSSGDLIADRRYAIAQDFLARGDLPAAADLLAQAIEAAPQFCSAWFCLGETREKLGERSAAVAAFQQVCALDPEDRLGAGLHLVRLGALPAGDMPAAYVRSLFDQYAARFDTALTDGLAYRGPALLRDAIAQVCAAAQRPMQFPDMLDLGCGTGLAGAAFRPLGRRLRGGRGGEKHLRSARARRPAAIPASRDARAPLLWAHPGGRRVRLSGLAAPGHRRGRPRAGARRPHRFHDRDPCGRRRDPGRQAALRPWGRACALRAGRRRAVVVDARAGLEPQRGGRSGAGPGGGGGTRKLTARLFSAALAR